MATPKSWALTQLGTGTSLELQIDLPKGTRSYTVTQFTASFAVNEIPTAQCLLAIGRDCRELVKAEIHASAGQLRQMRKARVLFRPRGEYRPDGTPWPKEFVIFDGYFMGLAYNKIGGKVQVVANLKHWLIDLACSSTLTQNSHPLNSYQLTARAVLPSLREEGASQSHYVSSLPGIELTLDQIVFDLWGGIKKLFCALTGLSVAIGSTSEEGGCGGTQKSVPNTRARRALARIEGPVSGKTNVGCSKDYRYGVPLPLELFGIQDAQDAVGRAITEASIESYANTTFWDKLVGEYCQQFNMALIPAVDYALVIADTPAFRGGAWQTINTGEYDSFQMQADLERPLRAIGVTVSYGSGMGIAEAGLQIPAQFPVVGGCYVATLDDNDDGVIHYVEAPSWIQVLTQYEDYAASTTGLDKGKAGKTATTPEGQGGELKDSTAFIREDVNKLLNQYAQSVFVANMLRGRHGVVGGKLRFDIAPGSVVEIRGSEEKFLKGEDELATNMVGCVNRVTIAINAEAAFAGTTLVLSHLRTDAENQDDRTSVADHPLFPGAIHGFGGHGSPLVVNHEQL